MPESFDQFLDRVEQVCKEIEESYHPPDPPPTEEETEEKPEFSDRKLQKAWNSGKTIGDAIADFVGLFKL